MHSYFTDSDFNALEHDMSELKAGGTVPSQIVYAGEVRIDPVPSLADNIIKLMQENEALRAKVAELEGRIEKFKSKIAEHKEAYHTDIFPDYSLYKGDKPSIDQVSGKMGRHLCDVFLNYLTQDDEMRGAE